MDEPNLIRPPCPDGCVPRRAIPALLLAVLWCASSSIPAVADGAELTRQQKAGRGLAVAGLVVQGLGMGLSAGAIIQPGGAFTGATPPFRFASIPFAPLTVAGFELWLDDGTPAGRDRAISTGLLEGSLYAAITAGLNVLPIVRHDIAMSACIESGECWEGNPIPFLIHMPVVLSHAAVALGFLIPGIVLRVKAERGTASTAGPTSLGIAPWGSRGMSGLCVYGSW